VGDWGSLSLHSKLCQRDCDVMTVKKRPGFFCWGSAILPEKHLYGEKGKGSSDPRKKEKNRPGRVGISILFVQAHRMSWAKKPKPWNQGLWGKEIKVIFLNETTGGTGGKTRYTWLGPSIGAQKQARGHIKMRPDRGGRSSRGITSVGPPW